MTRDELIQYLIDSDHLKTREIIEAFKKVDRKDFVMLEYENEAYENRPLPIGFHQTISQPLTVAFMLELLQPQPGEKILEIGAGSGWQLTLLCYLVGQDNHAKGKVFAIERLEELKEMAEQNTAKYIAITGEVAHIVVGDGAHGYPQAQPFHKIISAATTRAIPMAWKQQLRVGGRIVAPVGHSIHVLDKITNNEFTTKDYAGFSFVPLVTDEGGNGG